MPALMDPAEPRLDPDRPGVTDPGLDRRPHQAEPPAGAIADARRSEPVVRRGAGRTMARCLLEGASVPQAGRGAVGHGGRPVPSPAGTRVSPAPRYGAGSEAQRGSRLQLTSWRTSPVSGFTSRKKPIRGA